MSGRSQPDWPWRCYSCREGQWKTKHSWLLLLLPDMLLARDRTSACMPRLAPKASALRCACRALSSIASCLHLHSVVACLLSVAYSHVLS